MKENRAPPGSSFRSSPAPVDSAQKASFWREETGLQAPQWSALQVQNMQSNSMQMEEVRHRLDVEERLRARAETRVAELSTALERASASSFDLQKRDLHFQALQHQIRHLEEVKARQAKLLEENEAQLLQLGRGAEASLDRAQAELARMEELHHASLVSASRARQEAQELSQRLLRCEQDAGRSREEAAVCIRELEGKLQVVAIERDQLQEKAQRNQGPSSKEEELRQELLRAKQQEERILEEMEEAYADRDSQKEWCQAACVERDQVKVELKKLQEAMSLLQEKEQVLGTQIRAARENEQRALAALATTEEAANVRDSNKDMLEATKADRDALKVQLQTLQKIVDKGQHEKVQELAVKNQTLQQEAKLQELAEENSALRHKVTEASVQLEEVAGERDSLKKKLEASTTERDSLKVQMEKLQGVLVKEHEGKVEVQKQEGRMQERLLKVQGEASEISARYEEVANERDSYKEWYEELSVERDSLKVQVQQLQDAMVQGQEHKDLVMKQQLVQQEGKVQELLLKHQAAQQEVVKASARFEEVSNERDSLKELLEDTAIERDQLKDDRQKLYEELEHCQKQKASELARQEKKIEQDAAEAQTQLAEVVKELDSVKERLEEATKERDSLKVEVQQLRDALSQLKESKEQERLRLEKLGQDNARAELLLLDDKYKAEIQDLLERLEQAKEQKATLATKAQDDALAEIARLEQAHRASSAQATWARREADELAKSLHRLEQETIRSKEEASATIKELEAKLEASYAEKDVFRVTIAELKGEKGNAESQELKCQEEAQRARVSEQAALSMMDEVTTERDALKAQLALTITKLDEEHSERVRQGARAEALEAEKVAQKAKDQEQLAKVKTASAVQRWRWMVTALSGADHHSFMEVVKPLLTKKQRTAKAAATCQFATIAWRLKDAAATKAARIALMKAAAAKHVEVKKRTSEAVQVCIKDCTDEAQDASFKQQLAALETEFQEKLVAQELQLRAEAVRDCRDAMAKLEQQLAVAHSKIHELETEQVVSTRSSVKEANEQLNRQQANLSLVDKENEELQRQNKELAMTMQQLQQENEQLIVQNRGLSENVSRFEGDLEKVTDRHANIIGHVNEKQKIKYTKKLAEECTQLRGELLKARSRVAVLEGNRRCLSLFEALSSISCAPLTAGEQSSPGILRHRVEPGSTPLQGSPSRLSPTNSARGSLLSTPSRGAAKVTFVAKKAVGAPRVNIVGVRSAAERAAAAKAAADEELLRRCRLQERALERLGADFQHLVSLVERAVVGHASASHASSPSFSDLLKRLRATIASQHRRFSTADARTGESQMLRTPERHRAGDDPRSLLASPNEIPEDRSTFQAAAKDEAPSGEESDVPEF